jgi:hypothetical protein
MTMIFLKDAYVKDFGKQNEEKKQKKWFWFYLEYSVNLQKALQSLQKNF